MSSIYRRPDSPYFWIAVSRPEFPSPIRSCLKTEKQGLAEAQRDKIDALLTLQRLAEVKLPEDLLARLGLRTAPALMEAPLASATVLYRGRVADAVRSYLARSVSANSRAHLGNKVCILRQFFGSALIDPLDPRNREYRGKPAPVDGHCHKANLDEITPGDILDFMNGKKYSRAGKRHVREVMHGLFRDALVNGLYRPSNPFAPNPAAELPSYSGREGPIIVLNEDEVSAQLRALTGHSALWLGAAIMIEAGLRLHEVLALRTGDIDFANGMIRLHLPDAKTHSKNPDDPRLKHGERTITLRPPLAEALREKCHKPERGWLVSAVNGEKWKSDQFGKSLRKINRAAALPWTTQDYRHTFATKRIGEGWNIVTLAQEMGTSVPMLHEHYAAYLPPPMAAAWAASGPRKN